MGVVLLLCGRQFGRLRDECLNEHWFTSLPHAQAIIEAWRREYNEERPKKGLGGLTPAQYAKQLVAKQSMVPPGSKAGCYSRRGDVGSTRYVLMSASAVS
jgi:hypothetical protein